MKAIFLQNCGLWGEKSCTNKELRDLYIRKEAEGNQFKFPEGEELKKLNEICSNCKRALQIEEEKCSACGSSRLHFPEFGTANLLSKKETVYFYRCSVCGRNLYSKKKFFDV